MTVVAYGVDHGVERVLTMAKSRWISDSAEPER